MTAITSVIKNLIHHPHGEEWVLLMGLVKNIRNYYKKKRISPTNFKCAHKIECSKKCRKFEEAREPYIGPAYERGLYPRILFVSLDVPRPKGRKRLKPKERTVAAQQDFAQGYIPSNDRHKNRHWYQTHEMVLALLKPCGNTLGVDDVKPYFAHTNAVKCSAGNEKGSQAHKRLFDNCREYIGGELKVLRPDILVTQGELAFRAVQHAVDTHEISSLRDVSWAGPWQRNSHKRAYGVLQISGKSVLWLVTFHPQARQGVFFKQKAHSWTYWSTIVKHHWPARGKRPHQN